MAVLGLRPVELERVLLDVDVERVICLILWNDGERKPKFVLDP